MQLELIAITSTGSLAGSVATAAPIYAMHFRMPYIDLQSALDFARQYQYSRRSIFFAISSGRMANKHPHDKKTQNTRDYAD
jgi:hypothetical protein